MADGSAPRWFVRHPALTLAFINLVLLLAVEGVLRAGVGRRLVRERDSSPLEHSRQLHHNYIPGARFVRSPDPGDDFAPVQVHVNALGMRGPVPGPKQGRRVLIVGDSTVQADEIPFEQTVPELLNARMRPHHDFVAHGMMSWSPTVEFSWLAHQGLGFQPDDVWLFVEANDFMRASVFDMSDEVYRRGARYDGDVPIEYDVPLPRWKSRVLKVARRLELIRVLDDGFGAWGARAATEEILTVPREVLALEEPRSAWPADRIAAFDGTIAVIVAMKRYLAARGIGLKVIVVPSPVIWADEAVGLPKGWHPAGASPAPLEGLEAHVASALEPAGVGIVPLRRPFAEWKASHPRERLYLPADGHWNATAHRVVADVLGARYLLNQFR